MNTKSTIVTFLALTTSNAFTSDIERIQSERLASYSTSESIVRCSSQRKNWLGAVYDYYAILDLKNNTITTEVKLNGGTMHQGSYEIRKMHLEDKYESYPIVAAAPDTSASDIRWQTIGYYNPKKRKIVGLGFIDIDGGPIFYEADLECE